MKIRCLYNSGKDLLNSNRVFRLDTVYSDYGIKVGKEYLVLGLIQFNDHLAYLIDEGIILTCPSQLFEIIEHKLPSNWYFNTLTAEDSAYPFVEAVWGYHELCFEKNYYENLIVDMEETAYRTYFRRKMELEKELLDRNFTD